jgi:hypothetical protein
MKKPLFLATLLLTFISSAYASSHREAPYITKNPKVDATDFYMFMSYEPGREDYVTMISNYIPVQAAYGGPNYFPLDSNARYQIHIDNNGDALEDITFEFNFRDLLPRNGVVPIDVGGQPVTSVLRNIGPITGLGVATETGLNHRELYGIRVRAGTDEAAETLPVRDLSNGSRTFRKPFDYAGTKTFGGPEGYQNYADEFVYNVTIPQCGFPGRVFVGQRHEAFKIALGEVFDLVNLIPIDGEEPLGGGDPFPGGVVQDPARNTLAQNNVTSIALEVHKSCLTNGNDVIGAWSSSSLRRVTIVKKVPTFNEPERVAGDWSQVSRLGMPLVNELVIGYDKKDLFNSSHPKDDGQFATFVTNPVLPEILNILFLDAVNTTLDADFETLAPTNFPRVDLVTAFLTGFPGVNAVDGGAVAEMLRLNTSIPPTDRAEQNPLGLAAGDVAGFPNGRRPGDDVVDIALRVVMGALCHDLPLGEGGEPVNLGLCDPEDAVVGFAPFTDGAPLSARELNNSFPYLLTPYPGSPIGAPLPVPSDTAR